MKVRFFERHINLEGVEEGSPSDLNLVYIENADIFHNYQTSNISGKTLFYGPYARQFPWQVLQYSDATFVCIGEDDKSTIQELIQKFDNPALWDGILGLGNKQEKLTTAGMAEVIFICNPRGKQ